ncbi:hypothetical protein MJO28_003324 [Puccinia striiformis f. sp. tritici]|uniref:Uncharacterized protein n=1 Tax=Puccinia striiformis f. sp. tritici TaxID=168172 RepID=A0ACC0ETI2_9BASI|nr:hypothetical protein Pst134EB_005827 [Puccinia striiformis f. sp. tritici]KAI7959533.1 hypothetical protein MJO28_003324 [Puccinia striiformis f. sp. tritici]KAI7965289.1 hypothetical protein MJO29_003387 [Puccinia striiformis f. sp. tritici]
MALVCKWDNPRCRESFPTAEELFNHLCDLHVGRKRHGNLSLNCNWEACDHKAAKRDHMTSHMMVHCPLQTNVCGICSKTFKRSYDLRKHEVTHTAAHHQAHGRSRATIYKEVDISFTRGPIDQRSAAVNHSRVYSCPRDQSVDPQPSSSKTLAPAKAAASARRGTSVPGSTRNKPYLRPDSSFATETPNRFDSPDGFRPVSDTLVAPFRDHPVQFMMEGTQQYPSPAGIKADWPALQKTGIDVQINPTRPVDYSGLFASDHSLGVLETSAQECEELYASTTSSFNPYQSFGSTNPSSSYPLQPSLSTSVTDIQFMNFGDSSSDLHQEPSHYQYATNFSPALLVNNNTHYQPLDASLLLPQSNTSWQYPEPATDIHDPSLLSTSFNYGHHHQPSSHTHDTDLVGFNGIFNPIDSSTDHNNNTTINNSQYFNLPVDINFHEFDYHTSSFAT